MAKSRSAAGYPTHVPSAWCHGVELYYERLGDGPKLVYCNGSGATLDAVRPLLGMLASHFDLLAFDYRGIGARRAVHDG